MPLLGFTVFRAKVESGVKRQTIRKVRKRPIKVGDKLYLYWHLRQRDCRLLRVENCCEEFIIQLHPDYKPTNDGIKVGLRIYRMHYYRNYEKWKAVSAKVADDIARKDGFKDSFEMLGWFQSKYRLPEVFQVIRW